MDTLKTAQVNHTFKLYCKAFEYSKCYLKEAESLDDEQLAVLNAKLYDYLKEVYSIEK